jgi:NAD(P)-dependent dehydrogenase (short-subunit alcohol dehydrogenase family)
MGRLEGKVALFMGGANPTISGTTAHFMAREGARVAVSDIVPGEAEETAEFLRGRGYEAIAFPGDATSEDDVQSIVQRCVDHYGPIDILFNSAGYHYRAGIMEVDLAKWNEQFARNLTAAMLTTKHVARVMVGNQTKGAIIHISSDAGHQGQPGSTGYSAVKAGILNFARAAAMELAAHGIRVNTISPTANEHNYFRVRAPGSPPFDFNPAWRVKFIEGIPLQRLCRADDVANAAVFLASDEASFITAVDLPVDGGAMRKYWPWTPADYTGLNIEDYLQTTGPRKWGEEVETR